MGCTAGFDIRDILAKLFLFVGGVVFWHFPASLFIVIFPLVAFVYRALVEEKVLLEEFGREYEEYRKRTRMFI